MYPDLKVDWRTVCSRYNYHFGAIDEQNSSLNESANHSSTDASSVDHDPDLEEAKKQIPNGNAALEWEASNHSERVTCPLPQDDDSEGHNPKVKGQSTSSYQTQFFSFKTADFVGNGGVTLELFPHKEVQLPDKDLHISIPKTFFPFFKFWYQF